jgi:hypothetical protein
MNRSLPLKLLDDPPLQDMFRQWLIPRVFSYRECGQLISAKNGLTCEGWMSLLGCKPTYILLGMKVEIVLEAALGDWYVRDRRNSSITSLGQTIQAL